MIDSNFHPSNKHKSGYDFEKLCKVHKDLIPFVFTNEYKTKTIDFSKPEAVKALNKALLFSYYKINYWDFSDENLCPPIPGRVEYIHLLATLLKTSKLINDIKVLDIGTGATCIYPLLGNAVYDWKFIASDVDKNSLQNAQKIVDKNNLSNQIELRFQNNTQHILKQILKPADKISACMCNPPFYKNEVEANKATTKKLKGLGKENDKLVRNFSGTSNELWYKGGEKAFIHNYLYESSLFKNQCFWFTTLVSNKDNVRPMKVSLKKLGATQVQVIHIFQGNKKSRIVAWSFLNETQQKEWL